MTDSYEKAFNKLENIVNEIENENLTIEESIKAYEEGLKLYKHCNNLLNDYQGKIKKIIDENSNLEEDFLKTNFNFNLKDDDDD